MLKKRFSRFLVLIIVLGATFGTVFLMKLTGLFDLIFPNLKSVEGFQVWLPLLPPAAVCLCGQLFGDLLEHKKAEVLFFVVVKRILFLGVTALTTVWYMFSFDTDYSIHFLPIESAFMSVGFLAALFVYIAYVFAYIVWTPKKLYPFFFLIALAAALLVDTLLAMFWPEGGFYLFLVLIALPIVIFFVKPEERLFEYYSTEEKHDPQKIIDELAYLNDPHLRPGLDRDYDENGYYFGACFGNCVYYKSFRKNGSTHYYCALTQQSMQHHNSCDKHRKK